MSTGNGFTLLNTSPTTPGKLRFWRKGFPAPNLRKKVLRAQDGRRLHFLLVQGVQ